MRIGGVLSSKNVEVGVRNGKHFQVSGQHLGDENETNPREGDSLPGKVTPLSPNSITQLLSDRDFETPLFKDIHVSQSKPPTDLVDGVVELEGGDGGIPYPQKRRMLLGLIQM
ncbi:hypothetical protein SUGI_0299620 [Cryptomeria japonica]|nr:hypothetical protein SUGI_0299620 [Cryptomeria japonica]